MHTYAPCTGGRRERGDGVSCGIPVVHGPRLTCRGVREKRAQKALSRGADQQRSPKVGECVKVIQQGPVVVSCLGESEAWVQNHPAFVQPCVLSPSQPVGQLSAYISHNVVVLRHLLHPVAVRTPMHRDVGHGEGRHERKHCRVGKPPADVVDKDRACGERALCDLCPHRVDAYGHALGGEHIDDRDDPAQLFLDRHALGTWTSRLTPDVDQVGAVAVQLKAARGRGINVEVTTAITE